MPTGYTADIEKGIDFNTFIMQCARGMGVCVTMRDDPHDKPIPERFEPTDYHVKKISEIEKEIALVKKMTIKTAEKKAVKDWKKEIKHNEEYIRKAHKLREKYSEMLIKARAWNPPSEDHIGLKDFMTEQIKSSMDFDCSTKYWAEKKIEKLSGGEWLSQKRQQLIKDLDYHKDEHQKEVERVEGRNLWIKQLRDSL